MNYTEAYNIEDLRRMAKRRLPRVAYDFLDEGSEENATLRTNREVFERIRLQPRTLVDVSARSQQVNIFGKTYRSPIGVAPTGAAGLYGFAADIALARAARDAGVPFVLSTASFEPLEKVAREAAGGSLWFQLYMSKDRESARNLVLRALDAGYEALIVTTDVPVIGNRECNLRNGFTIPFRLSLGNMLDGALHPNWLLGVFLRTLLDSGVPRFRNTDISVDGKIVAKPLLEFRARREALDWDDLRWLRELWPHKLFVKGILRVDDAVRAAECGADGIFISNHGGRQLDGAISPIEVLPEIRAAVGRKLMLMVDGGIRRGSDVVKALALGADMTFVGRAMLYGIAAGGEAGALHALKLLSSEVDRVLALIGCRSIDELDEKYLWHRDIAHVAAKASRNESARMHAG
jgi:(S)-mandelate dehydrogenase